MKLDSFLEKDMIAYLDNAVNFGTQERVKEQSDVDLLLAQKDSGASTQPEAIPVVPPVAPAPPIVPVESDSLSSDSSPEWFDKLEEKEAIARAELDWIIDLEDALNDLQYALDQHDVDKAKALYDHILQETNKIKYHPQEKTFLLSQLKKISDEITSEKNKKVAENVNKEKEKSSLEHKKIDSKEPSHASSGSSSNSEFDSLPRFGDEETKMVYSYVAGVQAIRNNNKTDALEIFLHLIKERPKNLAIKIRLQEAIELP